MTSGLATKSAGSTFGRVLRTWRHKRGMSQLDLALASEVSQRHISFIESGRSQPSRDMVLRLATVLDVPLREQNVLLAAAGYAQLYKERDLTAPELQQVRKALECMLRQQEPYPAMVVDRHWYMLRGNEASGRLLTWLTDAAAVQRFCNPDGHLNLLRLLFHPEGLRPWVRNWHEVAAYMIERVHREAVTEGHNDDTVALLNELLSYPDVPRAWHVPNLEVWQVPLLTIELVKDNLALRFFSTITTLGTPHDITLQELRLECFFPADQETEHNIQALTNASSART